MQPDDSQPPFGACRLSALREAIRAAGDAAPFYWMAELGRKAALGDAPGPFDVALFGTQRARLHPHDNRCERRAVSGIKFWDRAERAALRGAARQAGADGFNFVDAGANVGLYTLSARADALAANVPFRGLAIEPDPINRARLSFNLMASAATDVQIAPVALSATPGKLHLLSTGLQNRGEVRRAETGAANTIQVDAKPLLDVITAAGLDRIDAMKIDIEGQEAAVLDPFLTDAPTALCPNLLIVETSRDGRPTLIHLLESHGYEIDRRVDINTIMRLRDK